MKKLRMFLVALILTPVLILFTACSLGGTDGAQGQKGDQGDPGLDSTVPGPQGDKGDRGESFGFGFNFEGKQAIVIHGTEVDIIEMQQVVDGEDLWVFEIAGITFVYDEDSGKISKHDILFGEGTNFIAYSDTLAIVWDQEGEEWIGCEVIGLFDEVMGFKFGDDYYVIEKGELLGVCAFNGLAGGTIEYFAFEGKYFIFAGGSSLLDYYFQESDCDIADDIKFMIDEDLVLVIAQDGGLEACDIFEAPAPDGGDAYAFIYGDKIYGLDGTMEFQMSLEYFVIDDEYGYAIIPAGVFDAEYPAAFVVSSSLEVCLLEYISDGSGSGLDFFFNEDCKFIIVDEGDDVYAVCRWYFDKGLTFELDPYERRFLIYNEDAYEWLFVPATGIADFLGKSPSNYMVYFVFSEEISFVIADRSTNNTFVFTKGELECDLVTATGLDGMRKPIDGSTFTSNGITYTYDGTTWTAS